MKNADKPASPCKRLPTDAELQGQINLVSVMEVGLTKREEFAKAAMAAILSNPEIFRSGDFKDVADGVRGGARVSKVAAIHADAQLAALEEV